MFNFSIDKRAIYILIAIMVITKIVEYTTNTGALFSLLLSIPGVLIAITFHEFAHGYVAYKLGDNTAKSEGRLSLNPFDHLDPIGSLMLIFAGFGWGKPVNVNPRNYTRKLSMEAGQAIVSLAGPVMNILLALVFTLIYFAIYKFAGTSFIFSTTGNIVMLLITSIISINVGLGVFNLIPLPPLDGSKVIMPFLPYKAKEFFISYETIFSFVFVILWVTHLAGNIISPIIELVFTGLMNFGSFIFGV